TAAVETLEDAATTGKSQLTKWDDDKTVKNLWAAGALPTSATAMLPGIGLEYSDLKNLPPELANLSEGELEAYLSQHPELRPMVQNLLEKEHVSDDEKAVIEA